MKTVNKEVVAEQTKESTLDLVGSIWENKAKSGTTYFTMKLNTALAKDAKITIFSNKNPKGDKSPNLFVFVDKV